jgi:hypothetical protein
MFSGTMKIHSGESMTFFLALVLIFASGFTSPQPQHRPTGEIRGVVTDRDGRPVSSAVVFVVPQALTLEGVTPRSAKTGEDGKFFFDGHFSPGTYTLYSRKEQEGYPDPTDRFYSDSRTETEIQLTADKPSATVEVRLGKKAGILEGRVIDVNTGAAITARLVFYDRNGNQHFLMVEGKYRALLPPGKDLGLMVSSPKYESRVAVARLQLEPGQQVHLDIPLSKE